MTETAGLIIGLVLTLFIYSYLVGDNPLYRIAVHLLVGVSAAYATVVAIERIILPVIVRVINEPSAPDTALWLIPIAFSLLLLFKSIRSLSWLGNSSVGLLVTVGAAVAVVGAVAGTIIPQVTAAAGANAPNILLMALLTVSVLVYFQFSSKAQEDNSQATVAGIGSRSVRLIGQVVLLITLGAVFAGVFTTSLILLIERISTFLAGLSALIGLIQL